MPASARVPADSPSHHSFLWSIRMALRNLFQILGFETASETGHRHHRRHTIRSSYSWGIFPTLPRDYVRRRRVIRRISNVVLVVLLSAALAYAIVHASGSGGFTAPHH